MVKVFFEKRNARLQGCKVKAQILQEVMKIAVIRLHKENGGNGDTPPPLTPSSTSSTISQPPPNSPKEHGKIPPQTPLLNIDIKFEFPMYNGEVNAGKLDNWIRQIEVYCRIQRIQDDELRFNLLLLDWKV
jgi:hypothetical protein